MQIASGASSGIAARGTGGNSSMSDDGPFFDYYKVLQVNTDCDPKSLEAAFRYLAKLFHPDHPGTADATQFNQVAEAYRGLRNPDKRAEYDQLHAANTGQAGSRYFSSDEPKAQERAALNDAEAHDMALRLLYKKTERACSRSRCGTIFSARSVELLG
ncbi:MAG: DnaJ domain-containing protein [Croceibacterium sp.]